jgi:hypothetical protein
MLGRGAVFVCYPVRSGSTEEQSHVDESLAPSRTRRAVRLSGFVPIITADSCSPI